MSVYDPYSGRYSLYNPGMYNQGLYNQGLYNQGLYRSPSARSYYPYAASTPYSAYTNATSDYYARSMTGGAVSERIYFSFDGKLIRSYKIRNYRVRRFVLFKLVRHPGIDFCPNQNPESAETCP